VRREFRAGAGIPGVALGRLTRVDRALPAGQPAVVPLAEAFEQVGAELVERAEVLRRQGQHTAAEIMAAVALIAEDPDLRDAAESAAAAGIPADQAVRVAVDDYAELLASLPDPTLAARAADVRAVGRRLLAALTAAPAAGSGPPTTAPEPSGPGGGSGGAAPAQPSGPGGGSAGTAPAQPSGPGGGSGGAASAGVAGRGGEPGETAVVLVGQEVAADDVVSRGRVVALASVVGGAGSHTAIVARALGIPAVFGVDPGLLELPDGGWLLVDGAAGRVVVEPDEDERTVHAARVRAGRQRSAQLAAERDRGTATRDGHHVDVYANVAGPADNAAARAADAPGIGLVRTEVAFLDARHWPGYAEHLASLAPLLDGFAGRPVTVRTLDFADDKLPPFLRAERGGALGRGLPLLLAEPAVLTDQLRAIVTAGAAATLSVMIPMVASVDEFVACARLLDRASDGAPRPPLGAMIELRAAVAHAVELARHADFFSIGSNDLTATLLGLDRRDPALSPLRAAEPVVLQAIAATVQAAREAGIPVSVCGDAAAEPVLIPLLLGLGVGVLSVAPAALDETRSLIRALDHHQCARAAHDALRAATLPEVTALGAACLPTP
jgi:phosphoenolpyruvate-protein kinase (PTS system EI component)